MMLITLEMIIFQLVSVLFHLHHNTINNIVQFKWHMSRKENLTPLDFNGSPVFDQRTGTIRKGNVYTDTITGTGGVPVRQMFWFGFGDLCYIADQLVRPINNLMKGVADPVPEALRRLPKPVLMKYFPRLLRINKTSLLHMFEDVGDCNQECKPLPKPTFMGETEQGRRQFRAYQYDVYDDTSDASKAEQLIYSLWSDLDYHHYCSPYVTNYNF